MEGIDGPHEDVGVSNHEMLHVHVCMLAVPLQQDELLGQQSVSAHEQELRLVLEQPGHVLVIEPAQLLELQVDAGKCGFGGGEDAPGPGEDSEGVFF